MLPAVAEIISVRDDDALSNHFLVEHFRQSDIGVEAAVFRLFPLAVVKADEGFRGEPFPFFSRTNSCIW
jgi:hypothetical protein